MATPTVEDFVAVQVAIREDRTLTVSGMPTSCPHLAVTPRVQIADGGQPVQRCQRRVVVSGCGFFQQRQPIPG